MKNLFTLLMLSLLSIGVIAQIDVKTNLFGNWPLDGDANEQIENVMNGTLYNCSSDIDRFGNENSSLWFNGSSSKVLFNQPLLPIDGSDWTLSIWFKPENPSSTVHETIFEQYGWHESDMVDRFHIFVMNDSLKLFHGNLHTFNIAEVFNQWYNVQITSKNSIITVYFECNEYLIGKVNKIQDTESALGYDMDNSARAFKGGIDDMKIFTRALSPTELKYVKYQHNNPSNVIIYDTVEVVEMVYDSVEVIEMIYDTVEVVEMVYDTIEIVEKSYISVTDTLIIDFVATNITPANQISTINVYPNPASDILTIEYDEELVNSGLQLVIVNSLAENVYTSQIQANIETLNIADLGSQGLYYIQIIDISNKIIDTKKLLVK